jgi:hypothetical protein
MERLSVLVRNTVVLVLGASVAAPESAPLAPAKESTMEGSRDVWAAAWSVALRTSMQ